MRLNGRPLWKIQKMLQIGAEKELTQDVKVLKDYAHTVVKNIRSKYNKQGEGSDFLSLFLGRSIQEGQPMDDSLLVRNIMIHNHSKSRFRFEFNYQLCALLFLGRYLFEFHHCW